MKFIKKNIYKILIALSLCLTLVLTITFTTRTYAQEENNNGYEILPNGIKSKNLLDLSNLNRSNGFIASNLSFISNTTYDVYLINLQAGNYHYKSIVNTYGSIVQANSSGTPTNNLISERTIQANTDYTFTLNNSSNVLFSITKQAKDKIMLNSGNISLNFFPYGTFTGNNEYNWNEDIIQENENLIKNSTSALYNALNGAYAELIGRNGTILASGNCKLEENTRRFDIGNLPNSFSNYYNNYDSENENYYTRPDIKIYLNYTVTNSLLFSFTDTQLDRTITLQNSNNTNSVTASNGGNEDMIDPYTLIINKENVGYDIIYYSGIYIPDYWNINFNISFDAYTYSQGYTKGVESQQTKINIAEGNTAYYKRLYEQTNANYEELLERYNQINDNNSLYGMIVAIADTPINIFKQIFNFDILGINISGVIFGLISLLVIIWLIKKLI